MAALVHMVNSRPAVYTERQCLKYENRNKKNLSLFPEAKVLFCLAE